MALRIRHHLLMTAGMLGRSGITVFGKSHRKHHRTRAHRGNTRHRQPCCQQPDEPTMTDFQHG